MNAYKLDPLNYYTDPGLSWDALLKYTAIELELLTDYDQHLFIEKGMRGGISMASKRHAKANNPVVPGYNPSEEHNHIMYYDANNLYGWAMSQPLPYSGFKWVDKPPTEPGKGCILEVDLECPAELHESHNDYPLAPEQLKVKKEWLSGYQANLLEDDNNEHSGGCRRQPSTPAEGGRRAKLVCRYRVYHPSEAIKLKTQPPPTGFLVLQSHHSHTCKNWGTSAFSPLAFFDWYTLQYFHVVFCMQ